MNNTFTVQFTREVQTYPEHPFDLESEQEYLESQGHHEDLVQDYLVDCVDYQEFNKEIAKLTFKLLDKAGIKDALAKYGLNVESVSLYQPRAYNYECDSLDITFTVNKELLFSKLPLLHDGMVDYMENVRIKSHDGYTSLEPASFDALSFDDSLSYIPVIHAILRLEGIDKEEFEKDLSDTMYENVGEWIVYTKDIKDFSPVLPF